MLGLGPPLLEVAEQPLAKDVSRDVACSKLILGQQLLLLVLVELRGLGDYDIHILLDCVPKKG